MHGRVLKKILIGLVALTVLYLGTTFLIRSLASDETKIRWLVAGMEEAYNGGHAGQCVAPLAKNWRHAGTELDRELLLGALFQASRERDPKTRQHLSRVEVDEDAAAVTVTGERATFGADATFSRLRRGAWEETWRLRIEAELENGADGWEIVASRHTDLRGTHLGR